MHRERRWESPYNADSDSIRLAWGLRFCVSNQYPTKE